MSQVEHDDFDDDLSDDSHCPNCAGEGAPDAADLLDPRQRRAAALLLGAIKLPAEAIAWATQYQEAARVFPGCTAADVLLGDPRGALLKARDLIDELLAEGDA